MGTGVSSPLWHGQDFADSPMFDLDSKGTPTRRKRRLRRKKKAKKRKSSSSHQDLQEDVGDSNSPYIPIPSAVSASDLHELWPRSVGRSLLPM